MRPRKPLRETPVRDDFFMGLACTALAASKNPHHPNGAVAVSASGREWSVAWDVLPGSANESAAGWLPAVALHAEEQALRGLGFDPVGGTLYTVHRPCAKCLGVCAHAGIKRVMFLMDHEEADEWRELGHAYLLVEKYKGNLNWMRDHIRYVESLGLFD